MFYVKILVKYLYQEESKMNNNFSRAYRLLKSILWTILMVFSSILIFSKIFPNFGLDSIIIIYGSLILITLIYCTYTIIESINQNHSK